MTHVYQLNWRRTARPTESCAPKNKNASLRVKSPRASGRSFVLAIGCVAKVVQVSEVSVCQRWMNSGRTNRLVQVLIPHIIDRTSSSSHNQSTYPAETDICERNRRWEVEGVGSHGNRPCWSSFKSQKAKDGETRLTNRMDRRAIVCQWVCLYVSDTGMAELWEADSQPMFWEASMLGATSSSERAAVADSS